jgi:hypothetical protein
MKHFKTLSIHIYNNFNQTDLNKKYLRTFFKTFVSFKNVDLQLIYWGRSRIKNFNTEPEPHKNDAAPQHGLQISRALRPNVDSRQSCGSGAGSGGSGCQRIMQK